jgi:carbamoylphosphate synthase small subunit
MEYDGLFVSNGPGDPAMATDAINNLKKVHIHQQGGAVVVVIVVVAVVV